MSNQANLAGRRFLLQSQQGAPLLDGVRVHLGFTKDELSASAQCNHLFGNYRERDGALIVDGMGGTEMGCDAERHAQDEWLTHFFTSDPAFQLQGNQLTLLQNGVRLQFLDREVADPDRPLRGTEWRVESYIENEGATGGMDIEHPRLVFASDGTFSASTGCSELQGTFTASESRLTIASASRTATACDQAKYGYVDELVRKVLLPGELTIKIEAGSLTMMRGSVGLQLLDRK